MSEFVFIFHDTDFAKSSAERKTSVQKWQRWLMFLEMEGHIRPHYEGTPLDNDGAILQGANTVVGDSTYTDQKGVIDGFFLMTAMNMAHAIALAKQCPILVEGGRIEIRPVRPPGLVQ